MKNIFVKVKSLSKEYRIYPKAYYAILQGFMPNKKFYTKYEALKDISFEVSKGDTLGIIGQNGAGKSTLLQIIAGINYATGGEIQIKGKIMALLELGAGFDPELTGRENIYVSASVLGMSGKKIEEKYDDIVDFADIGNFIEQPVRTYSSGMFARLAFAIAVHMDPEILILDEILSVGDVKFRQKCYRKVEELKSKCLIFFVSHDITAMSSFCNKVIWIHQGEVIMQGKPKDIMNTYWEFMVNNKTLETLEYVQKTKSLKSKKTHIENILSEYPKLPHNIKLKNGKNIEIQKIIWSDMLINNCNENLKASIKKFTVYQIKPKSYKPAFLLQGGEELIALAICETKVKIHTPALGINIKDNYGKIIVKQ